MRDFRYVKLLWERITQFPQFTQVSRTVDFEL